MEKLPLIFVLQKEFAEVLAALKEKRTVGKLGRVLS
jgi:hypothetical protein